MTMTEERKIRFQIAQIQRTKPCNVTIEKVEQLSDDKRKIIAKVKGYRCGCLYKGTEFVEMWRVI